MPNPVWPKSFKLMPHHLQQAQRARIDRVAERLRLCGLADAGVHRFTVDRSALDAGTFAVTSLEAVMPSGEIIVAEGASALAPLPVQSAFRASTLGADVFVALRRPDARGPNTGPSGARTTLRHASQTIRTSDTHAGDQHVDVETAIPTPVLSLHGALDAAQWESLFLARVVRTASGFALDPDRAPALANVHASEPIRASLHDLFERLVRRRNELAETSRWDPKRPERFDPSDVPATLLATTIARFTPLIADLLARPSVPPIEAYRLLVRLFGALRALDLRDGAVAAPAFDRDQLGVIFATLTRDIAALTAVELWGPFRVLAFEGTAGGKLVTTLDTNASDVAFVLGARGAEPQLLVDRLTTVAKFGSPEAVDRLAGTATRGIGVTPDLAPSPVLPTGRGLTFFRFDAASPLWTEARARGSLAVHLPVTASAISLRLYVINEQS